MANNNVKIGVDVDTRSAQNNTGNLTDATKSLKQEYKELTEAIAKANLEGKNNSKEYQEMIKRAGELKDAMSDANQAINAAASDTSNLDAVLGAASAATGGFGAATAIMEIMGANTDDVSKAQKRLQQAIALVNSVQAISNALNKDSALMVKLNAVAHSLLSKQMNATAIATSAATGALKLFKSALVSTGVGALVVGLGYLVEKLTSVSNSAGAANKAIGSFDEQTNSNIKSLQDEYDKLTFAGSALDMYKKDLEDAKKETSSLKDSYNTLKNGLIAGNKAVSQAFSLPLDTVKDIRKELDVLYNGTLTKSEQDEQIEYIEKTFGVSIKKNLTGLRAYFDAAISNREQYEEAILKSQINEVNAEKNINKEQDRLDKERTERRRKALEERIALEKQQAQNRLDIEKQIRDQIRSMEEKSLQEASDDEEEYYRRNISLLQKWKREDIAAENVRYESQLASMERLGLTEDQIKRLHQANLKAIDLDFFIKLEEANKRINQFRENAQAEISEARKKAAQDDINRELINMQNYLEAYQGSIQKELELKEGQLYWEKQLELEAAEETGADKMLIEEKYERMKKQLRIEAMNQYIGITQSTMDSISTIMNSFFPKNKQIQIATTIASTIANAAQAFGSTYAQAAGGPAAKAAQAALASAAVLAQGYAAVREIKGVTKDTQSFGGGTTTSVSEGGRNVSDTFITSRFSNINNGRIETVVVVDEIEAKMKQVNRVKVNSIL